MKVEKPVPQASSPKLTQAIQFASLMAVVGLVLYGLHACAASQKVIHYEFGFGGYGENRDIEVLNWRYGNSKEPFTQAPKEYLAMGHIPQGWNTGILTPPGDSLYVKWRVQSTGKIYEDTVDLKGFLSSDMDGKIIHYAIRSSQLYVYLIEGETSAKLHAKDAPDCPLIVYKPYKCTRVYPDHWSNF